MVYWFLFFTCILIGEEAENEWEWVELGEELLPSGYSVSTAMQLLQLFKKNCNPVHFCAVIPLCQGNSWAASKGRSQITFSEWCTGTANIFQLLHCTFFTSILVFVFAAVKDGFFLSDCKSLEEKGGQCVPSDQKCLQELYLGGNMAEHWFQATAREGAKVERLFAKNTAWPQKPYPE